MTYICPFCLEKVIEGIEPGMEGYWVHDSAVAPFDDNMCTPVAECMGVVGEKMLRLVAKGVLPWEV